MNKSDHEAFRDRQREHLFFNIARFCFLNKLTDGYYLEFGCHKARTMRLAWEHTGPIFDWTYVGFDSFAGLPESTGIDLAAGCGKGALCTSEETFRDLVTAAGLPAERLRTVKGFYEESLTPALAEELSPGKASVVFIDCDLYHSTVPALAFARPFLRRGTVIVFDDWFCFFGDPELGERRAWAEFRRENPRLRFVEFVQNGEVQAFICLGEEAGEGEQRPPPGVSPRSLDA